jgi:hypothetical protein
MHTLIENVIRKLKNNPDYKFENNYSLGAHNYRVAPGKSCFSNNQTAWYL